MALRSITVMQQTFPEGDALVGLDYEDTDLTVRRVWGRATFQSRWQVVITRTADQGELWRGNLQTLETSKALNPQQRLQLTVGSEGELVIPVSVGIRRA